MLLNLGNLAWNLVAVLISVTVWTVLTKIRLCIALQATLLFLLHVGAAAWACVKCFRLEANKKTLFSSILYQCGIQRLGRDPKHGHRIIKSPHITAECIGLCLVDQCIMPGTNSAGLVFWGAWIQLGPPMQKIYTFMEVWRSADKCVQQIAYVLLQWNKLDLYEVTIILKE